MTISEYYHHARSTQFRPKGEETDWLRLTQLPLPSGMLLVIDVSFVPRESDGLVVELLPGVYSVDAKVAEYGIDRRVGRLRVSRGVDEYIYGRLLGRTWTDCGRTTVCDIEVIKDAWGDDDESAYARIADTVEGASPFGVAILDAPRGAVLPFAESGFGDGEYPVRELVTTAGGHRIGIEVMFIRPGRRYPFATAASG